VSIRALVFGSLDHDLARFAAAGRRRYEIVVVEPRRHAWAGPPAGLEPEECLFVGGDRRDVELARRSGMTAILHRDPASTLEEIREALGMVEDHYRAAGGVLIDRGRVLVLRRDSRDEWRLPKGHVEPDEGDLEAAFREVAEEGGYDDLAVVADLGSRPLDFDVFDDTGPGRHVVREEHYFRMALRSPRVRRRAPADLKFDPRWLPVPVALEQLSYESEREWLRLAVSRPRS